MPLMFKRALGRTRSASLASSFTKGPSGNKCAIPGRRGARLARREERAYRAYASDEQRRQAGCIGGQDDAVIPGRALTLAGGSRDRFLPP